MAQDMVTQKYQFTITPLQITNKAEATLSKNKSIVIKLGESMSKTNTLNNPMTLVSQTLYSKNNKKYCPVKGIIKIYDILNDQNQIISCVGTFQIEDILECQMQKQIISKVIGSTTLKMQVSAKQSTQPAQQVEAESEKDSIVLINSQKIQQHSVGSQLEQQNIEANKIRRACTLNPGQVYGKQDIVDLKSAINFGNSKIISKPNYAGVKNSSHKLQLKAQALHQNNYTEQNKSLQRQQVKINQPSLVKKQSGTSFHRMPQITPKFSLDSQIQQKKHQKKQKDCDLALQIQSKNSSIFQKQSFQKQLKTPPLLFLPVFPILTPTTSNGTNSNQVKDRKQLQQFDEMSEEYVTSPVSPIMITSIKNIPIQDDLLQKLKAVEMSKNSKSNLQNSRHSIGSAIQNQISLSNLAKSIYNLGFISKVQSTSRFNVSGEIQRNDKNQLQMSNASATTSMLNQYQSNQIDMLGEQLISERRKIKQMQHKLQKYHHKIICYKQKYYSLLQQWDQWCHCGQVFVQNMTKDENGKHIIQISKSKQHIMIKFNVNAESDDIVQRFLGLTIKNASSTRSKLHQDIRIVTQCSQLSTHRQKLGTEMSEISNGQLNQVIYRIQQTYTNNTKLSKQNQQLSRKVATLEQKISELKEIIKNLQSVKQEIQQIQHTHHKQIEDFQFQIESISGINTYLKQKDQQMETIISTKQSTIQNMKKILQENNTELDQLEHQISQCKKTAQNKQLMLEEMKQELADKQQIIEMYRQVYGQINRYSKNRDTDEQIQKIIRTVVQNNRINGNVEEQLGRKISLQNAINNTIQEQSYNSNQAESQVLQVIPITSNSNKNIQHGKKLNNSTQLKNRQFHHKFSGSIQDQYIIRDNQAYQVESKMQVSSQDECKDIQNSILLSIIRNNQKIYNLSINQVRQIQKQLRKIQRNIQSYFRKVEHQGHLYLSAR